MFMFWVSWALMVGAWLSAIIAGVQRLTGRPVTGALSLAAITGGLLLVGTSVFGAVSQVIATAAATSAPGLRTEDIERISAYGYELAGLELLGGLVAGAPSLVVGWLARRRRLIEPAAPPP